MCVLISNCSYFSFIPFTFRTLSLTHSILCTAHFYFDLIHFFSFPVFTAYFLSFGNFLFAFSLSRSPIHFNIIIIMIESPVKLISFYCFDGAVYFVLFFCSIVHICSFMPMCCSWLVGPMHNTESQIGYYEDFHFYCQCKCVCAHQFDAN